MNAKRVMKLGLLLITPIFFMQCEDENGENETEQGTVTMKMTDAPSDNANIEGVFVTVTEVRIDGNTVDGFSKQTIDLKAYQQGETKLAFSDDVNVGTYEEITLVLDYESDESGNEPGCYVLTDDDTKHNLAASAESTGEFTVSKTFDVASDAETKLVLDFDLRKSIEEGNDSDESSEFSLASETEMQNALRVALEDSCGTVEGTTDQGSSSSEKIVVYAYSKGSFNASSETGQSNANRFQNCVTSSEVDASGNYHLAFLEEGNYEIHLASYDVDSEGQVTFSGMLDVNSSISSLVLSNIQVNSQASVDLDIEVNGFLGM